MLWTDSTASVVNETLTEIKRRNRAEYNAFIAELDDFYTGAFSPYFEGEYSSSNNSSDPDTRSSGGSGYLQRYFPNAYDNGKGAMTPAYLKFLRRLVHLKASLFHRQPQYIYTINGDPIEQDGPLARILKKVEGQCMLTTRLKELDRKTRLCKTAFAIWAWRGGKMNLDVYTPDRVDFWQDENDPANLDACYIIAHELPQPQDTTLAVSERRFAVWERPSAGEIAVNGQESDAWTMRVLNVNGKELPNPLFPDNVNRYGTYPYTIWHEVDPTDCLLQPPDESYRTIQIGTILLWSHYLLNAQRAGGTMVLKTQRPIGPSDLPIGMDRAILLEQQEEFDFKKIDFDAASMVQFAQSYMQAFAATEGIHPDAFAIDGQSFSNAITAVAKQMDRMDLQEEREDSEQYWEYRINDLIAKLIPVWNYHNPSERLPEGLGLYIKWAVPDAPMDPLHKIQARQAAYNCGLRSPVQDIMEENENMTEDEARSRFGKNLRDMRILKNEMDGGLRQTVGADPASADASGTGKPEASDKPDEEGAE